MHHNFHRRHHRKNYELANIWNHHIQIVLPGHEALESFGDQVESRLRDRRLGFSIQMWLKHHRRWIQVVDRELAPASECESFFSCAVQCEWGRWGALLPTLDVQAANQVADSLAAAFRARKARPPVVGRVPLLLGPAAAAIFLHEAVAHALEVDTLALSGKPEAAVGLQLGAPSLDLLDDPTSSPPGVRRETDDEGAPVLRRWLLRRGVVEQPLADRLWARESSSLSHGAGRRQSRHVAPVPRSLHLELLAGEDSARDLAARANDGLFAAEASRGSLDPLTGEFRLHFLHGCRLRGGEAREAVGPFLVRGNVRELLERVIGVGDKPVVAGAGWCAKGGQKLPVWSTTPALLLDAVEVVV